MENKQTTEPIIENCKKISLVIVGAGGTGSWLASFVSKLEIEEIIIIDGDIVEPKNTLRQNFALDDINKNKAEVVGERYDFGYIPNYITSEDTLKDILDGLKYTPVIIGAVDNNASRLLIHNVFEDEEVEELYWIDGGNAERHGQTYIAIKKDYEILFPSPLAVDSALAKQTPDERRPDQISCAEMQESAPQNVTANIQSAVSIFNLLNIVRSGGILLWNLYRFDTVTNTVNPEKKVLTD